MDARRLAALAVMLLFALTACRAIPPGLVGGDAEPTPEPEPAPITKTMCESAADLKVDVEFLRSMEVREDGLVSALVAVDATLGEAYTLVALMAEEYRPFALDLVAELEGLRLTVERLEQSETIGDGLVSIGEAIIGVGEAMDALELELREPCPEND